MIVHKSPVKVGLLNAQINSNEVQDRHDNLTPESLSVNCETGVSSAAPGNTISSAGMSSCNR